MGHPVLMLAKNRQTMISVRVSNRNPSPLGKAPRLAKPMPYRGVGSEVIRLMSGLYLRLTGWSVPCEWPDIPKAVIVAGPHTSNWDGVNMLAVAGWYRVKLSYMGKKSLTTGPLGWLVKRTGCIPIERSKSKNVVEQMTIAFSEAESLFLAVAPEATRKLNPNWKTGYYHIAQSAGVPLVMAVMDYRAKTVRLFGPLEVTGDYEADLVRILAPYEDAQGKHAENFGTPELPLK